MSMKVYVVTAGDFSDYHIERVFSTKEKAQEYLDYLGNANNASMEEYILDKEAPRGVFGYRVSFDEDGSAEAELTDFNDRFSYYRKDAFQYKKSFGNHKYYWFNIEAKDAPHAVKIASERLMQIKAMPYLFPRMKENCVYSRFYSGFSNSNTPIYDYNTKEIILNEDEWIE